MIDPIEEFFKLPEEYRDLVVLDIAHELDQGLFKEMINKYEMMIDKRIFALVISNCIVMMTRTHPHNKTVQDQKEFMELFLKTLNDASDKIGYSEKYTFRSQ